MTTRIALIAACLITGLVLGYNLKTSPSPEIRSAKPVTGTEPEVRKAILVEPEVRRAIPVKREVRKAIPVHEKQPAVVYVPIMTVPDVDADDDDELAAEESDQNEEKPVDYYFRSIMKENEQTREQEQPREHQSLLREDSSPAVQFINVWGSDGVRTYSVTRPNDTSTFIYDWNNHKSYSVNQPNDTSMFVHEW